MRSQGGGKFSARQPGLDGQLDIVLGLEEGCPFVCEFVGDEDSHPILPGKPRRRVRLWPPKPWSGLQGAALDDLHQTG